MKTKTGIIFLLALALIATPVMALKYDKVILISLDGVQYNDIRTIANNGGLKNISAMATEGDWKTLTISDHFTDTFAGHSEMLTGVGPGVTGVYDNEFYGNTTIPEGLTIWERVKARNETFVTGAIWGKYQDGITVFDNANQHIDYLWNLSIWPNEDDLYFSKSIKGYIVRDRTIDFITTHASKSFVLFVHFADPDYTGHVSGGSTPQYNNRIRQCDTYVGGIINSLKAEDIYDETLVIVTTDHGFKRFQKNHNSEPAPDGDPNCYKLFIVRNHEMFSTDLENQSDIEPMILEDIVV